MKDTIYYNFTTQKLNETFEIMKIMNTKITLFIQIFFIKRRICNHPQYHWPNYTLLLCLL